MPYIDVLSRGVFEKARRMPDMAPELFIALEEYDKTRKPRRWGNKVRVNFTIDPTLYRSFRDYCQKHGCKMSTLIERAIKQQLKNSS